MRSAYLVSAIRAAEVEAMAGLPEGALMRRAASALAGRTADFLGHVYGAQVLVLVGSGDNGGDALFAGAALARRGAQVEARLLGASVHEAGLSEFLRAGGRVVTDPAAHADVVIDGIVGIGGRPGLRPEAAAAVASVAGTPVIAVDVPSGVDVDTGRLEGPHVRADLTVTFGGLKVAHLADPAAQACGVIELVDLDLRLPPARVESLQAPDVRVLLPRPGGGSHKYSRGVVGVDTGSIAYPGAAVLSVAGANTGLAGMVRYAGTATAAVLAAHPEVVAGRGRVQAWVVGSGGSEGAARALQDALNDQVPVVVDADAIGHVSPARVTDGVVLTPHAGELAALLGEERSTVEAEPLRWARQAATTYGAVVLLKGRRTVVAAPDSLVRINTTGTPWLATAGSGDVLAGLIGSLLAAGLTPFDAASAGAWLHGAAAQLLDGSLSAAQLPTAINQIVKGLNRPGG